eukprot:CAMPEP_0198209362 /NCGR_PEP_ID=MMETSP1445-20131203/15272_1 /TAXON_ID=36898 /ORGANISM="Pyramimonas sp., Strain CCMP2087" /LENGTH=72 /DNA_ID=CAMNT_0043883123 /DNA_START=132 /DNA_END=350 /DNA_ORIENTATION=+
MPASAATAIAAIRAQQKIVQAAQQKAGFSYLLGNTDNITSVVIPRVLVALAGIAVVDGMHKMYFGLGKKEDF